MIHTTLSLYYQEMSLYFANNVVLIYLIFLYYKMINEKIESLYEFSIPFVFLEDHWTEIVIGGGNENVTGKGKGRDWTDTAAAAACDHLRCADRLTGEGWYSFCISNNFVFAFCTLKLF